jgi:hypothetical protein
MTLRFSRKRRLLQIQEPDRKASSPNDIRPEFPSNETHISKERRIPKLVPIMPAGGTKINYFFSRETVNLINCI